MLQGYSSKFVCIFCGIADHVLNQLTDMLAAGSKVFGHLDAVLAAAEIFRAVRGGFIISVGAGWAQTAALPAGHP